MSFLNKVFPVVCKETHNRIAEDVQSELYELKMDYDKQAADNIRFRAELKDKSNSIISTKDSLLISRNRLSELNGENYRLVIQLEASKDEIKLAKSAYKSLEADCKEWEDGYDNIKSELAQEKGDHISTIAISIALILGLTATLLCQMVLSINNL